jgi:hypothetical protein
VELEIQVYLETSSAPWFRTLVPHPGAGQLCTASFFWVVLACCADEKVGVKVALYQRQGLFDGVFS